ncbi:hypothetical protein KC926_03850 [Candidatus Kaiserbacteria bacterium]|nr:hypothetical protein [Candidatus Kaiserbacteria bacterium]
MHPEPQIGGLSHTHRKRFFLILVLVFVITLPSLIFYTTGYRISFDNEETTIVTTGGMYITTDNLEVDVYLDEEQVERPRLFRSAYYIQNIEAKQHRVVVQRPDLHTWVKVLPVDPYIVVEASAFNMPVLPHLRPITKYVTATGTPVYLAKSAPSLSFYDKATTTIPYLIATSTATTSLELNGEYVFASGLFISSSTSTRSVFEKILDGMERFRFATSAESVSSSTESEDVVASGDLQIVEKKGELYVVWNSSTNNIPYYFCVSDRASTSVAERYGQHVADEIERLKISTTTPVMIDGNRVCRPEIRLDRKWQDVYFYDFFPNSKDLILMQLEDGLYVTEIDDRSWQNTQLLYAGNDFQVAVENGAIYLMEDGRYFEIITEIEPN